MKIECVKKVGDLQIHRIYTFDPEKEADVTLVKETIRDAELLVYDENQIDTDTKDA